MFVFLSLFRTCTHNKRALRVIRDLGLGGSEILNLLKQNTIFNTKNMYSTKSLKLDPFFVPTYAKKKACFSSLYFVFAILIFERDWHNLQQYRLRASDSFCPVDLIIEITYLIFFATTGCSCLC